MSDLVFRPKGKGGEIVFGSDATKGERCFVRGDSIIGSAPELPYEEGEI